MVKVNLGGCASFVKDEDYKEYVGKALEAFDVLANESGAGNDFLGWKRLPSETPEALIAECEAVRDNWKATEVPTLEPAAPSRLCHTISPSSSAERRKLLKLYSPETTFPRNISPSSWISWPRGM